jgi:multiple sugar transport system ATP-binding protein
VTASAAAGRAAPVELLHVQKRYGDAVVVDDVNLSIDAGEFVVLVGPSGCGKSTTLRMVAGLETISAGDVTIGGRRVNDVPPAERDIAMVFQSYALYPHMSVRENMAFALKLRRMPSAEIASRVKAAVTTLGLETLLDRTPKQLSGGQRQRVAIGRAIVREPAVFLFDEPLSNLDAALRSEMRRELAALHRRLAATMLYVTHDQVEAMTLGDRIVVMNRGRIVQVGTPNEVYMQPRDTFVASFVGNPPMNLLAGTLVDRDGMTAVQLAGTDTSVTLPPALAQSARARGATDVVLGIRPEDVTLNGTRPNDPAVPGTIELVEPLGHQHLLHLRVGSATVTVRAAPGERPTLGTVLTVRFDAARLHLFDERTGVDVTAVT